LKGGSTHDFERSDPDHYSVTAFGQSDIPMEITGLMPRKEREVKNDERSIGELAGESGRNWREARVELHRRFAFPAACFAFALIAVPIGAQPRRGGRAAGSLIAVLLIAAYYLALIMGTGLAREGNVPPIVGLWMGNILLVVAGLTLLPRMEQFHSELRWLPKLARIRSWIRLFRLWRARARAAAAAVDRGANGGRAQAEPANSSPASFPRLMDIYLLRRFFLYFALLMGAFVFLFEAFTFFELLDNIARNRIPFIIVVEYFLYLTPYLLYQLAPLAALVAILVTIGVMSKNNEIVACKASGTSLYRLAVPLLSAGLALAVTMVVLDDTYLPYANQRQDALRNQIKGRPPQTYTKPQRWIFGENSKVYNYDFFDPQQNVFGGLTVLEIDPATFQVRRRVFASRAQWSDAQNLWVLESGWVRDFSVGLFTHYEKFNVKDLPELIERPTYFHREVRQAFQMNWGELRRYIEGLHKAGFDVSTLTVQWHRKLAFPLIAPVSMLLAFPFAFVVGTRGAVGGVAIGVGIGIAYWLGAELLAAMGGVGQLPPLLAGWSPDIVFFFAGLYFVFKMPT